MSYQHPLRTLLNHEQQWRGGLLLLLLALPMLSLLATVPDSTLGHWGIAADFAPGKIMRVGPKGNKWVKRNDAQTIGVELRYQTHPSDNDPYAADYNYPAFGVGLRYGHYQDVTLHKLPEAQRNEYWEPADYLSSLGDIFTLYTFFERPIVNKPTWSVDYRLDVGAGYSSHRYDRLHNIDNVLIGSHWLIYYGMGVHGTYYFAPQWGLRVGLEFAHHSNGALRKPNKGANFYGPMFGIVYRDTEGTEELSWRRRVNHFIGGNDMGGSLYAADRTHARRPTLGGKPIYGRVAVGVGAKAQLEGYSSDPNVPIHPEVNTHDGKSRFYMNYTVQADLMCRYARRWSSGVGLDLYYSMEAHRLKQIDGQSGHADAKHSPWSVGIAGKHEVHYGNLSLNMALGLYLYREMGRAVRVENKPYYERVGLKYSIPGAGGLFVGGNVKAHVAKANLTEIVVGVDI